MRTIQLTDEQYNALMQGEPVTIEPPKPKVEKWQPKGGEWGIYGGGGLFEHPSARHSSEFGMVYATEEAAEKARDAMRPHNRLLAWVSENDDGWVADWSDYNQCKWSVLYNYKIAGWRAALYTHTETPGMVYMSKANAEKLCKLLNDGVVEL